MRCVTWRSILRLTDSRKGTDMKKITRLGALAAFCLAAAQLTGCANLAMTAPQVTTPNVAKIRTLNMAPAAVGTFKIDPSKASSDASVSMRGANSLQAPSGSFAQYLGESLKVELQSAGLLDPASTVVISGTLTTTELHAAIGTGAAKLSAKFVVTRGNACISTVS
jgi:hypothetical protein